MNVTIRRMRADDLPAVLALEQEAFPEDAWSPQMFAGELAQPQTRHYIVAETSGTIVGYAGLCAAGDQADVQTIAVRAGSQGNGIGTTLLGDLLATARARGGREVYLDVRVDNDRARRLYQRTGFTEVGVRRGYYRPSGTDAIVMRLQIPARREQQEAGKA